MLQKQTSQKQIPPKTGDNSNKKLAEVKEDVSAMECDLANLGEPCEDSPHRTTNNERLFSKGSLNTLVVGTSNCRDLTLKGDDDLELRSKIFMQGGLKIAEATAKLNEAFPDELLNANAAVMHVGSCDFPVETDAGIEFNYMKYVETLTDMADKCPNANLFMSSVPPRKGQLSSTVNQQIRKFNAKLRELAESEANMTYVDNEIHLSDGIDTLEGLYESKGDIHLNREGKARLASNMFDAIKSMSFRDRLQSDWEISV